MAATKLKKTSVLFQEKPWYDSHYNLILKISLPDIYLKSGTETSRVNIVSHSFLRYKETEEN